MRKHREQMSKAEQVSLDSFLRTITESLLSQHAQDRMAEKNVTPRDIELTLKYGHGIEIHNDADELRAVLRFAYGKPKVATCIVIGLQSGTIVTTWKNAGDDNHRTLNLYAYQWKVDVKSLLEGKR